jgi:hypothetical protein
MKEGRREEVIKPLKRSLRSCKLKDKSPEISREEEKSTDPKGAIKMKE